MTAFNYTATKATADRLLTRFGQTAAIRRYTAGGGPAHNPGTPTSADTSVTVAVFDYKNSEIDNTSVLTGDKKVYLSAQGLSITPELTDKVVINSIVHSIVNIMPLSPAGTVVMYELQARQ